MKRSLLAVFAVFAVFSTVACDGQGGAETSATDQRVARLVESLSLEQKVAQMIQGEIKHVTPDDVREYGLGSVLNGGGSFPNGEKLASLDAWTALADDYYAASIDTSAGNAGIPIIWGTDAVHGHNNVIGATLFPHNIGLGAANDPTLVGKIAAATAREVKATGIDWIFAPTIAVAQDPRWGRTYESFSSDTARVAQFAAPIVEGMQSEGMVATAKHFIGDGGTFKGIDQGDTRLSLEALLDIHGAGYYEALDAGVMSVMATFNSWNGDKIHGNHELLTKVLKERLAFEGFVVSDWNGIGQVDGCTNANCAQAINAGIDMIMAPEDWKELHGVILEQVRAGEITEARIDDAVTRILKVKAKIGLLDRKSPSETAAAFKESVGSPEHRALARQAVRRSLVMLKNEQGLIPLHPKGAYLITGPAADDIGMQSGGWTISWQGTGNVKSDFPGGTSILDGLAEHVDAAGGRVLSAQDYPSSGKPDAVIYAFGETPYAEGVGDIETLAWQQRSQHDKKAIDYWRAQGVPVVSVFVTGRPRWVNAEINASNAFVVAWLPGSEGSGVADVLFKDANGLVQYDFVGRLPMAWPANDVNATDPDRPVEEAAFSLGFGLAASESATFTPLSEQAVGKLDDSTEILFEGGARAPWMIYLGDEKDPALAAGPGNAKSAGGGLLLTVTDRDIQEDARRLQWIDGGQAASIYFGRGQAWDASGLASAEGALTIDWRWLSGNLGELQLLVSCGADCGASLPIAPMMANVVPGKWLTLSLPLRCLSAAGVDITRLESPFGLQARGPLMLEFSAVSVTDAPAANNVLDCPSFSNTNN